MGSVRGGSWLAAAALSASWLTAPPAARVAHGQDPGPAPSPAARPEPAPDSPRASLAHYLDLCRAGRSGEAARYLALPPGREQDGPRLARRLKAVLDRHLWVDLESVSPEPRGDPHDRLPGATDQIGVVPGGSGRAEPVLLQRVEDAAGARWVFAPATIARVDAWYDALHDRWLREYLPEALLRPGPRDLLYWQWFALPLLLFLAWAAGRVLAGLARSALCRLARGTRWQWDDALLDSVRGPLVLGFTLAVAAALVPSLSLYAPAQAFVNGLLRALGVLAFFWAMWGAVDVAAAVIGQGAWTLQNPSARSLLAVGVRIGKVGVLGMGLVAGLSELGYPVASLLAGLGLGGLALALAAQKTVENLFGSVSLAVDQPIRVGDFVKVEDFVGTVETIGLRSTSIRTLDRTLVSIPNGRLADMRLESFSARDRMRLACTIGLVYGTTAAQMRQVLEGCEAVLRAHPKIWLDAVVVRFQALAASSLDIEVMAWFQTPDWSEFQAIRQDVLLQFMEVVEKAGTHFAFPTRTVHLVDSSSARRP
jgi:MscS family membrane protein